jgi:hypothetical protein
MLDKLTTKETKEIIIFSKEFKRKKEDLITFCSF